MTGLPAAATASSASWSSAPFPAPPSAKDSLVNQSCHPERGRAPKRFLQLGKPESKDLGFDFSDDWLLTSKICHPERARLAASNASGGRSASRGTLRLRLPPTEDQQLTLANGRSE